MSKKEQEVKDCIGDEMKDFKPVGNTAKDRAESVIAAFKKAADDCKEKLE